MRRFISIFLNKTKQLPRILILFLKFLVFIVHVTVGLKRIVSFLLRQCNSNKRRSMLETSDALFSRAALVQLLVFVLPRAPLSESGA